jgi:Skp family chaperone for outer membrane proteins
MKTTNYMLMILLAGLFTVAGCGKSSKPQPSAPPGVIDLGKLQQAFPAPRAEVRASLAKLNFAKRYGDYQAALAELDKLAQLPDLTDAQKQAINDMIQAVKQKAETKAPTPPAQ